MKRFQIYGNPQASHFEPESVLDNGHPVLVADALNELHDRITALERRAGDDDSYRAEQGERGE